MEKEEREIIAKYSDIIGLPHHVSRHRRTMTLEDRAAQFAAFDALSGYGSAIKESEIKKYHEIQLSEEDTNEINRRLRVLSENDSEVFISVIYFLPHDKKKYGRYVKVSGRKTKLDDYKRQLVLISSGKEIAIPMKNIYRIESEIFKN